MSNSHYRWLTHVSKLTMWDPEENIAMCSQYLKLSQKSCRSSCHESQIMNIELKKYQQKVLDPPRKLSASDLWEFPTSCFQHCVFIEYMVIGY